MLKIILFAYFFLKLIALVVCASAGVGICSQADTCTWGWQMYEFVVVSISICQTGFASCRRVDLWVVRILYMVPCVLGPRFVPRPRSRAHPSTPSHTTPNHLPPLRKCSCWNDSASPRPRANVTRQKAPVQCSRRKEYGGRFEDGTLRILGLAGNRCSRTLQISLEHVLGRPERMWCYWCWWIWW